MDPAISDQVASIITVALTAAREQEWDSLPALTESVSRSSDRLAILAELTKESNSSVSLSLLKSAIPWLSRIPKSDWSKIFEFVGVDHFGAYHLSCLLIQSGGLRGASLKQFYRNWQEIEKIDQLKGALAIESPPGEEDDHHFYHAHGYLGLTRDDIRIFRERLRDLSRE
jgi:hypothetical protein